MRLCFLANNKKKENRDERHPKAIKMEFFFFYFQGARKKKQRNRIKVDPRVHVTHHGGWIAVKANDDNRLSWEGGDEDGKTEGMIKSQPLNFED